MEARKQASKQPFWSHFFERFLIFPNGVFECCNGVFKCFEGFKVVVHGSKCVCGGSKAVLVLKVLVVF